jgi:hypothetical protein
LHFLRIHRTGCRRWSAALRPRQALPWTTWDDANKNASAGTRAVTLMEMLCA